MGTHTMEQHGSWWSYPIYACGLVVGAMSPQEWLVFLSLVAVCIRIFSDLPSFFVAGHKIAGWLSRAAEKIRGMKK